MFVSRRATALALAGVVALTSGVASAERLRAGFGQAALPSPDDGPLAGYGGLRTRRASTVLDPPEARAVVLDQGDTRLALVAVDLVIVRPELSDPLRAHAASRGVDAVVLTATHTHSGPGGYIEGWWAARITAGTERPGAADEIGAAARSALDRAIDDLAPAQLGATLARAEVAENRRFADGHSETKLPVVVLRFPEIQPWRPPIVIAAHPAHPTILSPASHAYSADYVGPARRKLAKRGWRALLVPGAIGDQQPKSALGPLWPAELGDQRAQAVEVGEALAQAILAAAIPLPAPDSQVALAHAERDWSLPDIQLRRFCPLWWGGPFSKGVARDFLSARAPVQVLRAGAAWFAAVPAEPSSDVGEAIRALLPASSVPFVVAHSNDWTGYVVTAEAYARGGYESCMSFHGPGLDASLVGEVGAAVRLLDSLEP